MFKKTFSILSFFLFYFIFISKVTAYESINDFTSSITIYPDASVSIIETINYDFSDAQKHGLIRDIPVVYQNKQGEKYRIKIKINGVTDELGNPYKYSTSIQNDTESIKIGEINKYVTGAHVYSLDYIVSGVITYFSDHDEFYWNVTGNQWIVPIEKSQSIVKIDLPETVEMKGLCFTGPKGSKNQDCDISYPSLNSVSVSSKSALSSGEGLTFVVSFPKNIVKVVEPEKVSSFFNSRAGVILLLLLGVLVFLYYVVSPIIVIFLWFRYGRDPKTQPVVRAWYDPPKDQSGNFLKPALVGTLVDERADNRDISATIVDLAIRGFYKIHESEKGKTYWFEKKKNYRKENLSDFEIKILEHFFKDGDTITTTELKKDFYLVSSKIKNGLYDLLVTKGYFPKNPQKIRNIYYIIGGIAFFTGNILLGLACFIFGSAMPRKTIFGAESQKVALGLKNFLVSQERQIKFQAKNWFLFEKLLPYAIVFGVEKIWADRFKDISVQPPSWYEGTYSGNFNSVLFIAILSKATNNFASISSPQSSTTSSSGFSSGFSGGSSGGGFGGGGGSSW